MKKNVGKVVCGEFNTTFRIAIASLKAEKKFSVFGSIFLFNFVGPDGLESV